MPVKKPVVKSIDELKKSGLPCESFRLKDLQVAAKAAKIPVKVTLKTQCEEIKKHVDAEPKPQVKPKRKSLFFADDSDNDNDKEHDGYVDLSEVRPEIAIRREWMKWVQLEMSDEFITKHFTNIHITSDKQGRSNSIIFEATIQCPVEYGPYPFDYKKVIEYGWQNVALKIYRQYYYIDNGGIVEQQIYEQLINNMTTNRTCDHFVTLLATHKIAMNRLIPDSKIQIAIRNKLGILSKDKDIELTVLVMDYSNNSSTLEGMLEREKSIDSSPAKLQQYLAIIFQILYALRCCSALGIKHNDLHFRNILVEKLKFPETMHYNLLRDDEKLVRFKTDYWVRIIDFDQASVYHPRIYRNMRLDLHSFCEDHNICNYTSENEHYDGYGFLFQMLQTMKVKSPIITNWIKLFISDEAEAFIKSLKQVTLVVGQHEKSKPTKKNVADKKKDSVNTNDNVDHTVNWFHQERIHFGAQNVATSKVTQWYEQRNLHFPTVIDLLHSMVSHPFQGKKLSHNIFDKITFADVNNKPHRLQHYYQVCGIRPLNYSQPMQSHHRSFKYIPPQALIGLQKKGVNFSNAQVQKTIQLAEKYIDGKLAELNLFEHKSILPIWKREMQLLKYNWFETAKALLHKYWVVKEVQIINDDLFIAALLLSCPMYYGMTEDMNNLMISDEISRFISDMWSTFDVILPITVPSINGV